MTIAHRFDLPTLAMLNIRQFHVVMAVRLCVIHAHGQLDPVPPLAARLRSVPTARALAQLTLAIDACWPDAFVVHRPCCARISPDEATLAALVDAVERRAGISPQNLLSDMLPQDKIVRLTRATAFAVGLLSVRASPTAET